MTDTTTIEEMQLERRANRIAGMREALDFLEANPSMPMPYLGVMNVYVGEDIDVAPLARIMKPVDKDTSNSFFMLTKKFGVQNLVVNWSREAVCERVVVSTRLIPGEYVAAHTIPARTEETVEWVCPDSILDA